MTTEHKTITPKRSIGGHQVNPIGLGCMSLSFAYGRQPDDKTASTMLHQALELGYDHLDTARLYGNGHNEQLIGRTLKGLRKQFYLASKAGIYPGNDARIVDCRPQTLRKACEESLRCLQTDYIDLYYLHRRDVNTPIAESIGALAQLIKEGKIGGIGLSEVNANTLREAHAVHPVTAVQNEYSLWTRNPEIAVLETCRELGIAFVAFSPLGRGALANGVTGASQLLENDFRSTMPRFMEENWTHNFSLIQQFNKLALLEGVTPAQLALAWVLSQGDHVLAIPGTGQPEHLLENIDRAGWQPAAATLSQVSDLINQQTVRGHRYSAAMRAHIDSEEFG